MGSIVPQHGDASKKQMDIGQDTYCGKYTYANASLVDNNFFMEVVSLINKIITSLNMITFIENIL